MHAVKIMSNIDEISDIAKKATLRKYTKKVLSVFCTKAILYSYEVWTSKSSENKSPTTKQV